MMLETCLLVIAIGSLHLSNDYGSDYNQFNPGITIQCNKLDFGFYKNSYGELSIHGGVIFEKKLTPTINIGTNIGLVSGYAENPIPYLRPYIDYKNFRVGYIPGSSRFQSEHTLTFEWKINW